LPTRIMTRALPEAKGWHWCKQRLFSVRAWSFVPPLTFLLLWVYVFSWSTRHDGLWVPKWLYHISLGHLLDWISWLCHA